MNPESVRTFIAIELPASVRSAVEELETQLRKTPTDISWVHPKNIHITLKFLGDTAMDRLAEVSEGIREAVTSLTPFQVALSAIGAFPGLDRPRVIWVDVSEGRAALIALQSRIEQALCARRFVREERPFSPHLTIGRVRSPKGVGLLTDRIRKMRFETPGFEVRQVVVVKSELRPSGAVYTTLDRADLV